ncbi:MAG: phosphate ABC transporter substrate-binding protein PstS [Streptosporangiaceae bacterium]
MPANDARHYHTTHRTRAATLSAGTAVLLTLAAAACTASNPASTSTLSPAPATSAAGASSTAVTLTGAGSTFDAPFFDLAFAKYHQQHPAVTVHYSAVGSSAGIAAFTGQHADFGASDVPMTGAEQAAAHGGASVQVPVDLGAEVVVYHLPSLPRLHLTGPVIARIFLGQITNWDDPAITSLNPSVNIPSEPITVVHRSDGSGTTYIFSNYLSAISPAWASKVGTGKSLHWPAGVGAEGNPGVANAVAHIAYSIGYIERSYSKGPILTYAAIRNQAGNYVIPSTASIAADAAQKPTISATDFSIVNEPGANSYPISGYSWALVYTHQPSQATGQALVTLLDWLTHAGQAYAAATSYVPLPTQIQQLARTMIQKIVGPNGANLHS